MPNASNVSTGKPKVSGAIYRAPIGSTLPTDAVAALDTAFVELGYVSSDGVVNNNSPETSETKAWGADVVEALQTAKPDKFSFTLIESLNENVLKAVYGDDNVSGSISAGLKVKANSAAMKSASWVIEMILKDNKAKRIVIPNAKISELGEIVYKDDDVTGYKLTLTAVPDSNGDTHIEYIK